MRTIYVQNRKHYLSVPISLSISFFVSFILLVYFSLQSKKMVEFD